MSASALYTDVSPFSSAYKEIKYLVDKGYIQSLATTADGTQNQATHADLAYLLAATLKIEVPTIITESPFSDVSIEDPRLPTIITVSKKTMSGNAKGHYMPDRSLTRAQVATILVKAFSLKGTTKQFFKDVPKTHSAYNAIQFLVANKITSGYANIAFKPSATITKRQLTVFIARILNPALRQPINKEKSCVL